MGDSLLPLGNFDNTFQPLLLLVDDQGHTPHDLMGALNVPEICTILHGALEEILEEIWVKNDRKLRKGICNSWKG